MKLKVNEHGANWFLAGLEDEDSMCPECHASISIGGDSSVAFEHPKKKDTSFSMKCQCTECGCIYTRERPEKEILKAVKEADED